MADVTASVKGTAFATSDAANTAALALAAGIKPGDDLQRVLKEVGDAAAFTGKDFGELSPIFTEAAEQGKVTGETLAQMRDNGIPATSALAKHLGKTAEEVADMASKGEIDFKTFQDAMDEAIGGQALKSGQTFSGAMKNVDAALGRVGETLLKGAFAKAPEIMGKMTGVIDDVNAKLQASIDYFSTGTQDNDLWAKAFGDPAQAQQVMDTIDQVKGKIQEFKDGFAGTGDSSTMFGNLGESFGKLWEAAQRLAPAFGDIAGALGQAGMQAGFAALTGVLAALAPIIADVITPALETLGDVMKDNPALVTAVVGAFTGFKTLGFVSGMFTKIGGGAKTASGAFKFLSGVIGAGKGGGIGGALVKMMEGAKSANPVIAKLGTTAAGVGKKLVALGNVKQSFGKISGAVSKVAGVFKSGLVKAVGMASKAFKAFGAVIMANPIVAIIAAIVAVVAALVWFFTKTELGKKIWKSFMDFLGTAWQWIKDTAVSVWTSVADFFTGLWDGIKTTAENVWNGIKDFFSGLWDGIKNVFTVAWTAIKDYFTTAWENFKTNVETVWNGIKTFYSLLWEGIKLVFTTAWTMISTFFTTAWAIFTLLVQTVWNTIVLIFQTVWNTIVLVVTTVWNSIAAFFSAAWAVFTGVVSAVWNGIVSIFTAVWNWIRNIITSVWSAISGWVSGQWAAFTGLVSSVWNGIKNTISNVWNSIKSGISSAVSAIGQKLGEWVSTAKQKATEFINKVQEIPGKVKDAFANAGQWLYNAGRDVVQGLLDGIGSLIGSVGSFISDHLPFNIGGIVEGWISADGSVAYARGGVEHNAGGSVRGRREKHVAQIAAGAGPVRIWAEPETGGEAYIPLARSKRRRSSAILAKTAEIMGYTVLGTDGQPITSTIPGGDGPQKVTQRFAKGGIRTGKEMLDFARGKTVAGQRMDRPLEGAPYNNYPPSGQWGDCSYTAGSLAAFLTGHNPRQRNFATGSQESILRSWGFTMGKGPAGTFRTAWYNGGPWGGHTASTLPNGINAEMGGGRGNGQLGGGAAGYNLSGATNWAWMRPKADASTTTSTATSTGGGSGSRSGSDPNVVEVNAANTAALTATTDDSPKSWSDITSKFASDWTKGMTKDLLSVFGFEDSLPPIMQAKDQADKLYAVDEKGEGETAVNKDIAAATKPASTATVKRVAPGTVSRGEYKLGESFYIGEIAKAAAERGLGFQGAKIGVATALVEAGNPVKMWASSVDTASLKYKHDAVGSDYDSSGVFQQRNNGAWGAIADRMNARGSASMFFNQMVKKFPNWKSMDPGAVAQGVQVSAYPGRYNTQMATAERKLAKWKGKLPGFRDGGIVTGGRGLRRDDVLANLSRGEAVINSRSVGQSPQMAELLNSSGPGAVVDWILDEHADRTSAGSVQASQTTINISVDNPSRAFAEYRRLQAKQSRATAGV
jgi:tape measure domain-containing protein